MSLRTSYIVLAFCLVACGAVCFWAPENGLASNLALNLGSGIIGIGMTVFLIDRVIERQQRDKEMRYAQIAFMRLTVPLSRHISFWATIVKATVGTRPAVLPGRFVDLCRPEFLEAIKRFKANMPAPIYPPTAWSAYMETELRRFTAQLDAVVDKYAFFLTPEEIMAVESVSGSDFLREYPALLSSTKGVAHAFHFCAYVDGCSEAELLPFLVEYLRVLGKLCTLHDEIVGYGKSLKISESIWSDNVEPKYGALCDATVK